MTNTFDLSSSFELITLDVWGDLQSLEVTLEIEDLIELSDLETIELELNNSVSIVF